MPKPKTNRKPMAVKKKPAKRVLSNNQKNVHNAFLKNKLSNLSLRSGLLIAAVLVAAVFVLTKTFAADNVTTTYASEDTYTSQAYPDRKFSGSSTLAVKYSSEHSRVTYIKFNVAGVSGKTINNVKLRIKSRDTSSSHPINVYLVPNLVSVNDMTWNSQPNLSGAVMLGSLATVRASSWNEVTLTRPAWTDGPIIVALTGTSTDNVQFQSMEAYSRPKLLFNLDIPTTNTATPPKVSITSNPLTLVQGGNATLTWTSTNNASSCNATGDWSGVKAVNGTEVISNLSVVKIYNFGLSCTNSAGSGSATASVNVTASTASGGGTGGTTGGTGGTTGGTTGGGTPVTPGGALWKPTASARISWNWVIGKAPTAPFKAVSVYDIDGFDNTAATVSAMHSQGIKVICYIDVGTYEPGRPDLGLIPAADIGSGVQGWPGEKWLNISDINGLRALVTSRMQMCASKGFDAIEPDNIDGYTNSTGFPLTAAHQIAYNTFLATTAHSLGMSIGLKNDVDQTSQLVSAFDWALDEECNKYSECGTLAPFTNANKAVFVAEYVEDGMTTAKFCSASTAAHQNGVLFALDLNDSTFQPCTTAW